MDLSAADADLLRVLQFNKGTLIIRAFSNKSAYSHLVDQGFVIETHLQHGDVHVSLTDSGRRALTDLQNEKR